MDDLHAGRLRRLADFLDELKPEQFDLTQWWCETSCGLVACAGGWAMTIPEFRAAGFRRCYDTPCFESAMGLDACSKFFGLSYDQARNVFLPDSYATGDGTPPAAVARRLRAAADGVAGWELGEIE